MVPTSLREAIDLGQLLEKTKGIPDERPSRYRLDVSEDVLVELRLIGERIIEVLSGENYCDLREQTALNRPGWAHIFSPEGAIADDNRLRLMAHRQNEPIVQEEIARIANVLATELTQNAGAAQISVDSVKRAIHAVLNAHLRGRLEKVGEKEIFHLGGNIHVSTKIIKKTYQQVQKMVEQGAIQPGDALLFGLHLLGAVPASEIAQKSIQKGRTKVFKAKGKFARAVPLRVSLHKEVSHPLSVEDRIRFFNAHNHQTLNNQLETSLRWARGFTNEIISYLQGLIRELGVAGKINLKEIDPISGEPDMPDINTALKGASGAELLAYLFEKGDNHRDYNDAQMFSNFSIAHWTYQRLIDSLDIKSMAEIERAVESVFERDESGRQKLAKGKEPLLEYKHGRFEDTGKRMTQELKVSSINGTRYPMYVEELSYKSPESTVQKQFREDYKSSVNDTPDLRRTALVAWTVTRKMMSEDDAVRKDLSQMCQSIASELGLKLRPDLNPAKESGDHIATQLEPGEFALELPEKGSLRPFTKIGILARLKDGAPLELQILPIDVHCVEATSGTGLAHDEYKNALLRALLREAIPNTVSHITQVALDIADREHAELRSDTLMSMSSPEFHRLTKEWFEEEKFVKYEETTQPV